MQKLLFICGKNRLRSPTAENVFSKYENLEVRSAGLDNDAEYKIGAEDIEWADIIFLMEDSHKHKLGHKFGKFLKKSKIVVLGIPDNYKYMEEKLIDLLIKKVNPYLK